MLSIKAMVIWGLKSPKLDDDIELKTVSLTRSGRPPSRDCNTCYIGPFKLLLFLIHGYDRCEYIPKLEKFTIQIHGQLHEHLVALTTADLQGQSRDTMSHFKDKNLIISSLLEKIMFLNSADVYSIVTFDRQTSKSCISDARFHESLSRSHIPRTLRFASSRS